MRMTAMMDCLQSARLNMARCIGALRRKAIRPFVAVLGAVGLVVALGACGTSDVKLGAAVPGYDVSRVAKNAAVAAEVPSEVSEDGVLTVGSETTYAPVEFVAEDGRTAVGFEIDIAKALARVMGLKEQTIYTPFDSAIPGTGYKFDVSISGFTLDEDRMQAAEFVSDYSSGLQFVVKKGNPKHVDTTHLCGRTVAAQTGTLQESDLMDMSSACKAKGEAPLHIQSMSLQTDVTTAVTTGKAEAFFSDATVAGYAVKQTGDTLQTLGKPIDEVPQAMAVKKGDMATAKALRDAMNSLIKDGTYGAILKYWGVEDGAITHAVINPKLPKA